MRFDRQLVDAALAAARDAAHLHRSEAGRLAPSGWSEKGTADFVTEVDREAERGIIASLRSRFPGHAFLAEEGTTLTEEVADPTEGGEGTAGGGARGDGGASTAAGEESRAPAIRWIIDPLDGTTNWLHDYPEYAVSIAAFDDRGLRVGVVVNSATGDEFDAVRGGGSRRNGEPIRTSELRDLRLGLIGTGFPFKRRELLPRYLRSLGDVLAHSSGVRRAGAAALDLCALAMGRLDAFWEFWLMPWDVAAGALIVQEAGGVFDSLHVPDDPLVRLAGEEGARFVRLCSGEGSGRAPDEGAASATTKEIAADAAAGEGATNTTSGRATSGEILAGATSAEVPGGGGYVAANAHLLPALREVLGADPARAPDTRASASA